MGIFNSKKEKCLTDIEKLHKDYDNSTKHKVSNTNDIIYCYRPTLRDDKFRKYGTSYLGYTTNKTLNLLEQKMGITFYKYNNIVFLNRGMYSLFCDLDPTKYKILSKTIHYKRPYNTFL